MAGEKILIIDDDFGIIELCKNALSDEGYFLDTARTGKEAMDMLGGNEYDLAIIDWRLPDV